MTELASGHVFERNEADLSRSAAAATFQPPADLGKRHVSAVSGDQIIRGQILDTPALLGLTGGRKRVSECLDFAERVHGQKLERV